MYAVELGFQRLFSAFGDVFKVMATILIMVAELTKFSTDRQFLCIIFWITKILELHAEGATKKTL